MANFVIKNDGSKEAFDAEKVKNSIRKAAGEAGVTEDRVNEIVEQVTTSVSELANQKEEITAGEIKAKVLSELDIVEPSVSEAWRKYEQTKANL